MADMWKASLAHVPKPIAKFRDESSQDLRIDRSPARAVVGIDEKDWIAIMILSRRHSNVAETERLHIAFENRSDSAPYVFTDNVAHVH